MKKFLINSCIFIVLLLLVFYWIEWLSVNESTRFMVTRWTDSSSYLSENVGPGEICPYIDKARSQDGTTKLIIGDSVCRQMFNGLQEYNPDISIIGSNAAITMSGQYILVKEYLDNHPDATDVSLIVLPGALATSYDTSWGYQYAVMPFVETDTIQYLEPETIAIMESVYGKYFLRPDVVKAIDLSGLNRKLYLNMLKKKTNGYQMSDPFELANIYVYRIYELCQERDVYCHLYACPVSEEKRDYVESLRESFYKSPLYEINPYYLDSIYYYLADQSSDGVHFAGEYAKQAAHNERIQTIYAGTELLDNLRFDW